jgi:hypothetical protein
MEKIRSPETGIYSRKPESEWRRIEIPEQRVISEELWTRTHERLKVVQDLYGVRKGKRRGRAAASPYLFTGPRLSDLEITAHRPVRIARGGSV